MRYLLIVLFPAVLWAQNFEFVQEWDSISIEIDENPVSVPWTGGYGFTNPALVDLDGDGDYDLPIGHVQGLVAQYQNEGNAQIPDFKLTSTCFQNITDPGRSAPFFVDADDDGDQDLFIDGDNSPLQYYCNNGNSSTPVFQLEEDSLRDTSGNLLDGSGFCLADLDGDGDYDLLIGKDNDSSPAPPGALHYWENVGTPHNPNFVQITQQYLTFDAGNCCEPDLVDMDGDGDLDLFFTTNDRIGWMRNTGTAQSPAFHLESYDLVGSLPPVTTDLADLDGDSLPDLVTADGWGGVISLRRCTILEPQPTFVPWQTINTDYLLMEVTLGDLDADGNVDLLVGGNQGVNHYLLYYQNQGTPHAPDFVLAATSLPGVTFDNVLQSALVDMDGDLDLLIHSNRTTQTRYYENIGTPQQMNFQLITSNLVGDSLILAVVDAADIDGDGDVDVFSGHYDG